MKRLLYIFAALFLALGLSGTGFSQQALNALATLDFSIVGVGIGISPEYQAVPKGINSQVLTQLNVADGCPLGDVVAGVA